MPRAPAADRPLVVVKWGGSLITRKREVERSRPKVIARLAREVAACRDVRIVLLHGAGSFGHPGARRFGLARPPPATGAPDRVRGAAIVAAEVRRLHLEVLRALVAAGAAPQSVPVPQIASNREGGLVAIDAGPFEATLERGALPVSFGDVVPDDTWGYSILSADTIAVALASILRPARVVFATDVPGVLTPDGNGRPTVVPELTEAVVAGLAPPPGATDVTGGIRGKAAAALAIARHGVDAGIISGLSDGALSRAIRGESVHGSWASAQPAAGTGP